MQGLRGKPVRTGGARRRGTLLIPLFAVVVAGCGSDDGDDKASTAKPVEAEQAKQSAPAKKAPKGTTVKFVDSQFGSVAADRKGEAFYLFAKEKGKKSECYGACAEAWPPVYTKGKPRAGKGAKGELLGTTRRRDGRLQVTYGGHPMYYYVDDSPGVIKCHKVSEFGGLWLVVKPNGKPAS